VGDRDRNFWNLQAGKSFCLEIDGIIQQFEGDLVLSPGAFNDYRINFVDGCWDIQIELNELLLSEAQREQLARPGGEKDS
jgi:hypothetical protein